jgi:DNA-binding XRE family transcriptional regulator
VSAWEAATGATDEWYSSPEGNMSVEVEFDEIGPTVCKALRALRIDAGLPQRAVASMARISVYELSRIENGRRIPSYAVAARIADALDHSFTVSFKYYGAKP